MSFQISQLNNGSKLLVVKLPQSFSTTLMILSRSGPIFDPLDKTGISHFIEHLLFKGNKKYLTNEILSYTLEKYGAVSEAFSYQENNAYWIKIPKDNLNVAVDLLTQQLQNSLFRLEDIKFEKGVVEEELNMVKSNPSLFIWELWTENIWKNSPLGRIYTGSKEEISSFSKSDVTDFFKNYYTSQNTVFVVSGDISMDQAKQLLNKNLTNYSNQLKQAIPLIRTKRTSPIKISYEETDNLTVAYGFLTTNHFDKDSYVLELIDYFLGRGQGSCLNQKIANVGLTYSIVTSTQHLSNTGYFLINFTSQTNNLNRILKLINNQLNVIKTGKFGDSELERAKGYYIGQLLLQNDTTDNLASWYGYQAVMDIEKILTIEQKQQIIQDVTKKDLIRVANKYFSNDNWYLSAIGPVKLDDIKVVF